VNGVPTVGGRAAGTRGEDKEGEETWEVCDLSELRDLRRAFIAGRCAIYYPILYYKPSPALSSFPSPHVPRGHIHAKQGASIAAAGSSRGNQSDISVLTA
jgi:hypothetical protein